jgi:hypothetical protein
MNVVLPDELGPAMQMTRTWPSRRAISSAMAPILFSWNPSETLMIWLTRPDTHASLNAPTLVMPSALEEGRVRAGHGGSRSAGCDSSVAMGSSGAPSAAPDGPRRRELGGKLEQEPVGVQVEPEALEAPRRGATAGRTRARARCRGWRGSPRPRGGRAARARPRARGARRSSSSPRPRPRALRARAPPAPARRRISCKSARARASRSSVEPTTRTTCPSTTDGPSRSATSGATRAAASSTNRPSVRRTTSRPSGELVGDRLDQRVGEQRSLERGERSIDLSRDDQVPIAIALGQEPPPHACPWSRCASRRPA